MKYLLVLLVAVVGLWVMSARFRKGSADRDAPDSQRKRGATGSTPGSPRQMVSCSHCGVHLPADEAVTEDQLPYCSVSHRQAGPR